MAYVNGVTSDHTAPNAAAAVVVTDDAKQVVPMPPERLQKIRELLSEPFDPGEIKWRVTATSTQQTKHGPQKRGQLIAYADQRAYTDRLNEVFGEWGWTRSYDVQVGQNFERRAPGDRKETAIAAKVLVVARVTIHGLGSHSGVGEDWADDENAATRAEAQAFKRACSCFGLGRYLYNLDKSWVDLDEHNRPAHIPDLPDWARPVHTQRAVEQQTTSRPRREPRQSVVRKEILESIRQLREKVGHSLALFVLNKYTGGAEPEEIGHAKLTNVLEKLADIGNGIDRLRKAAAAVGSAQYSAICRELNLASDSIDDIPDRNALKMLLAHVEAEAAGSNANSASGDAPADIGSARGRLLQAARKIADRTGKRLADVITEASDGKLALENLKKLTDADVALVSTATARMA